MVIVEFIALSATNLVLIAAIIRKRGIASAEGFCMAYLGLAAVTDNVALVVHYLLSPDSLPLGYREFAFRLYPTAVEILGLLILIAGLQFADGRARPVSRQLDEEELLQLRNIGVAITAVGLTLAIVALYLVGAFSISNFYGALNRFRSQELPFGGFWYRGADIAVFGLALTLPSLHGKTKRLLLVLALMMTVSFFLRANKGGLEEPLIWGAVVLFVYNEPFLKTFFNFKTVALALIIAFAGVGAKFWIVGRMADSEQTPSSFEQVVAATRAAAAMRWGDNGLYRGYCQFVNALPTNRALFHGSKVGVYSLTSWVPRFFYPDKPDHPFRGLGFMIYSDFHSFPDETPAPMLVGSAMADKGFVSLSEYLFLAGLFLGWFRRFTTTSSKSLYAHCGYMFFVLFGGFSAEEGTLGVFYTLLLAYGVIAAARSLLFASDLVILRPTLRPHSAASGAELDNLPG
jgi:hypothetical protein